MKRLQKLFAFFALLTVMLSFCACTVNDHIVYFSGGAGFGNVFRIGDMKCSVKEAKVYLSNYKNIFGTFDGISLWREEFDTASMESSVKDAVISHLSNVYAFDLYARDEDITLTKKEEESIEAAAEEYYNSLSKEELKYLRVSKKDIANMYEHYALAQKVYAALMETVDNEVSEDEARVMDAYVLFVTDAALADRIAEQIQAGEDFERLVNTYSEVDKTVVSFGRHTYSKEMEDVVFQLNNGQISSELSDENGYYFFQCVNKYNIQLSEENKSNVIAERKENLVQSIIASQNEQYYSHLNTKLWDNLAMNVSDEITTDSFFYTLGNYLAY